MNDLDVFRELLGGVSRRDFLKYFTIMASSMGLPLGVGAKMAEAVTNPKRPSVIWLSAQECTGCTESLLRATHPTLDHLILDLISLDYHETLSTPAGHQAEEARQKAIRDNKGKFVLVVDGSIPVKDGGVYCMIGGKPVLQIVKETAPQAGAIIAIGSCASWGGVPSADPNPTGATPVHEILKGTPVVNIPGCPASPYNFLSTVLYYLTFKKLPELDDQGRPKFAYGRLIHENCERRPHFDAGRFAVAFGDDNHRQGYCLYKLGCKGPETYNNCPSILYGDVGSGSWPVGTGHPCFGCSEKGVGFTAPLHALANIKYLTPNTFFTEAYPGKPETTSNIKALGAATAGVVIGAAGAAMLVGLGKKGNDTEEENKEG
ncbi:MAG: hydrogenase 2 small subunit [Nitrospirae bacterium GWC2_57_13]|nr:MAG: hydrogenase 2 small subunit [Nitrospirae bacterium GWC2_57_13]OGW44400.1 MAG: hydrogenase 2 small subunit [Nitrospirae bacterium GWD2_57_8]